MPDPTKLTPKQLWQQEEARKKSAELVAEATRTDTAYDGDAADPSDIDAKNDWEKLVATAKLKFPEHIAARFTLTPKQRVTCIARCLGWTVEKIAEASGVVDKTIYRWLKLDQAIEFMKLVEMHTGSRDAKELIDLEQFNSLMTIKEIRDDRSLSATTRLDAAKWFYEAKHGKSKETKEVKDITVRQLTEQLMKVDPLDLLDEPLEQPTKEPN